MRCCPLHGRMLGDKSLELFSYCNLFVVIAFLLFRFSYDYQFDASKLKLVFRIQYFPLNQVKFVIQSIISSKKQQLQALYLIARIVWPGLDRTHLQSRLVRRASSSFPDNFVFQACRLKISFCCLRIDISWNWQVICLAWRQQPHT